MARAVHLNDLDAALAPLDYPIDHADAAVALEDVTLVYADGEEPLLDVLERTGDDVFTDPEDLRDSLFAAMPTEAVGEPGQSEGDG